MWKQPQTHKLLLLSCASSWRNMNQNLIRRKHKKQWRTKVASSVNGTDPPSTPHWHLPKHVQWKKLPSSTSEVKDQHLWKLSLDWTTPGSLHHVSNTFVDFLGTKAISTVQGALLSRLVQFFINYIFDQVWPAFQISWLMQQVEGVKMAFEAAHIVFFKPSKNSLSPFFVGQRSAFLKTRSCGN